MKVQKQDIWRHILQEPLIITRVKTGFGHFRVVFNSTEHLFMYIQHFSKVSGDKITVYFSKIN